MAAGPGVTAHQTEPTRPGRVPSPPAAVEPDRAGAATLPLPESGKPELDPSQRQPSWKKLAPEFRIEPGEPGSSYDLGHVSEKAAAAGVYEIAKEGTKVGRFEVRALLGRGSSGQVYRAFDPLLGARWR